MEVRMGAIRSLGLASLFLLAIGRMGCGQATAA